MSIVEIKDKLICINKKTIAFSLIFIFIITGLYLIYLLSSNKNSTQSRASVPQSPGCYDLGNPCCVEESGTPYCTNGLVCYGKGIYRDQFCYYAHESVGGLSDVCGRGEGTPCCNEKDPKARGLCGSRDGFQEKCLINPGEIDYSNYFENPWYISKDGVKMGISSGQCIKSDERLGEKDGNLKSNFPFCDPPWEAIMPKEKIRNQETNFPADYKCLDPSNTKISVMFYTGGTGASSDDNFNLTQELNGGVSMIAYGNNVSKVYRARYACDYHQDSDLIDYTGEVSELNSVVWTYAKNFPGGVINCEYNEPFFVAGNTYTIALQLIEVSPHPENPPLIYSKQVKLLPPITPTPTRKPTPSIPKYDPKKN